MEKKLIQPEDYLQLAKVAEIDSSNGMVAWTQIKPAPADKSYISHIRMLKNGKIRQFTAGSKKDFAPKFSPDGKKLLFLSTRAGKPQAFVIDLQFGGEAIQVTHHPNGITSAEWSPDSTKIAFTARINKEEEGNEYEDKEPPKTEFDIELKKLEEKKQQEELMDPYVTDELVYREGTTYHDKRKQHIYIQNIDQKKAYRISKRWTNHTSVKWAGNDTIIAFAKIKEPTDLSKEVTLLKFDLQAIDLQDEDNLYAYLQEGKEITTFLGYFGFPIEVSPNTEEALTYRIKRPDLAGNVSVLIKVNLQTGEYKDLTANLDRNVANPRWISQEEIIFNVEHHGTIDLRKMNLNTLETTEIYRGPEAITSWTTTENTFYFTASSVEHPWAVWKFKEILELVEDPNQNYLDQHIIVKPEEIWFDSPSGGKFQGWYFPPATKTEGKPPLALHLHGGPHTMWTPAMTMWHEFQCFAAKGYAVLATNPKGSTGYGEEFTTAIVGEWGEKDFHDIQNALETIKDRYDPNHMYVLGGSYAGFQTANIISRDKRFKAAVAQRGVYDNISFTLTTDIPLWFMDELQGDPWEEHDKFWKLSPLSRAKEIQTPLLIIAATNDFRVPISQSEELFAALRLQNKEAVLVRYPRDGHELSRSGEPNHVVDRIKRMIQWFENHK